MSDLISVQKEIINGAEVNSVNARELHRELEVKTVFSNWIRRAIDKYDFIENEDYIVIITDAKSGKRDYIVTLDIAKELAMLENNDKGKKVRKYFIKCEKEFNRPLSFEELAKQTILLAQERIEELQHKIEVDKPKVEFFNAVTNSTDAIDMGSVAKLLNKEIGRNKLFELLRVKEILQRDNTPYQKYVDRGYFRLVESKYQKPDGSTHISLKTVVYQKGINYINKVLELEEV